MHICAATWNLYSLIYDRASIFHHLQCGRCSILMTKACSSLLLHLSVLHSSMLLVVVCFTQQYPDHYIPQHVVLNNTNTLVAVTCWQMVWQKKKDYLQSVSKIQLGLPVQSH